MIITPIHEYNHCHGADDGRFCAELTPADRRKMDTFYKKNEKENPGSSTLMDAIPEGALEWKAKDRPKTVQALADWLIGQYATALGITPVPVKIGTVAPERDLWDGGPGGYMISAADARPGEEGGTLYLTQATQDALGVLLRGDAATAGEKRRAVQDGVAIFAHELAHAQSAAARDAHMHDLYVQAKDEPGIEAARTIAYAKMLEEGLAAYVGGRAVQRLIPSARYEAARQGYDAGRALWARADEKFGPDIIRMAMRAPDHVARRAVLEGRVPKDLLDLYTIMDLQGDIGPPNAPKLARQVIEAAAWTGSSLRVRIESAQTRAELLRLKREAHVRRSTLTPGQQFEVAEQYAIRWGQVR